MQECMCPKEKLLLIIDFLDWNKCLEPSYTSSLYFYENMKYSQPNQEGKVTQCWKLTCNGTISIIFTTKYIKTCYMFWGTKSYEFTSQAHLEPTKWHSASCFSIISKLLKNWCKHTPYCEITSGPSAHTIFPRLDFSSTRSCYEETLELQLECYWDNYITSLRFLWGIYLILAVASSTITSYSSPLNSLQFLLV